MIKWYTKMSDYDKYKFWWKFISVLLTGIVAALFINALVFFLIAAWTVDPHLQSKLCATGGISILACLGLLVTVPAVWSNTW